MLPLLLALALRPEAECVQLRLASPKTRLQTGESTRVEVTTRIRCDTRITQPRGGSLFIDDGTGFREFSDVDEQDDDGIRVAEIRRAGDQFRSSLLVGLAAPSRFAFPQAGQYRIEVRRKGVRSNVLKISVAAPQGEDAACFAALRESPELLTKTGIQSDRARTGRLLARCGRSVYTGRILLTWWREELGGGRARAEIPAFLDEIEATDLSHTAFEASRLLFLGRAWDVDQLDRARRTFERLARDHPGTAAGEQAKTRLRAEEGKGCLRVSLALPKRIRVGEATKAAVTYRVVCDAEAPHGAGLRLDDGTGYRTVVDVDEHTEAGPVRGTGRLTERVTSRGSYRLGVFGGFSINERNQLEPELQFAFPKAGTYRVHAFWGDARSNVVSVTAVEPDGEDARALEDLRKAPEVLTWMGRATWPDKARDLVARHPGSPYLAPVQLGLWRQDIDDALTHDNANGPLTTVGRTAALLSAIESAELTGTPFDVDRLFLVAKTRLLIGDKAGARRVYERIVREHPDTPEADWAKGALSW